MDKILSYGQFMTLCAGVFLIGGGIILLFPSWFWFLLGLHFTARDVVFLARVQSPWAICMGILAILLRERDISEPDARAYLWTVLIGCTLAFLLALNATLRGIVDGFGWFAAFLFLSLALLSGYYLHEDAT